MIENKKNSQINFRTTIDEFFATSLLTNEEFQFTPEIISDLFSKPIFQKVLKDGQIDVQMFCSTMQKNSPISLSVLKSFDNKKYIKPQQLFAQLQSQGLQKFNVAEQIENMFFVNNKFSMSKLDSLMKQFGYDVMNAKDKQLLLQCLDIDKDKIISHSDIQSLLNTCKKLKQSKNNS